MASTIVLITGANSGVGFAATKIITCASKDFHVIMACRSLDKAEEAMSEIKAAGAKGSLSTVQLDVTDEQSIEKAVSHVEEKFGHLDALINNAGISSKGTSLKSCLQETLEVNVIGPALVADAFRPLLLKSSKPYMIYVSSCMGSLTYAADKTTAFHQDGIKYPAYRASKAALNMVAIREIAQYGESGLNIFMFCPGYVRSNLRGTSEEEQSGGGHATDPDVSGQTLLSILEGKRDADMGKFVHKDGVYPW